MEIVSKLLRTLTKVFSDANLFSNLVTIDLLSELALQLYLYLMVLWEPCVYINYGKGSYIKFHMNVQGWSHFHMSMIHILRGDSDLHAALTAAVCTLRH